MGGRGPSGYLTFFFRDAGDDDADDDADDDLRLELDLDHFSNNDIFL